MKISIQRSGGIAGINRSYIVDTDTLSPDETRKIKKMVQDGRLFELRSPPPTITKGSADYYSYSITLDDNGTEHIVNCNQFNVQKELKLLIDYVENSIVKSKTNLHSS